MRENEKKRLNMIRNLLHNWRIAGYRLINLNEKFSVRLFIAFHFGYRCHSPPTSFLFHYWWNGCV